MGREGGRVARGLDAGFGDGQDGGDDDGDDAPG
jgi:hypothetical protein